MGVTYFKRYRMEISLQDLDRSRLRLPEGFEVLPWSPTLLRDHARVKWESFKNELDANVFPCLGTRDGCRQLMHDITVRANFVPEATWLMVFQQGVHREIVGTVQGLRTDPFEGAIQNLGIAPEYRDQGLGGALLFYALDGFASVGCQMAHLEVTVQNTAAVRLYQRLGFRRTETVFKVADVCGVT